MLLPLCQLLIDHRDWGLFLGSLFCSISLCVCSYASTRLSHYFFEGFFCTSFLFLPFWGSNGTNAGLFNVVPQASEAQVIFKKPFFFLSLLFKLDPFYWSVLKLTDFPVIQSAIELWFLKISVIEIGSFQIFMILFCGWLLNLFNAINNDLAKNHETKYRLHSK